MRRLGVGILPDYRSWVFSRTRGMMPCSRNCSMLTRFARSLTRSFVFCAGSIAVLVFGAGSCREHTSADGPPGVSQSSPSDFRSDRPGVVHKITLADLPPPYATKAVDNGPTLVARPSGALP